MESSSPDSGLASSRPSLFDAKDDFIARMGPIGVAAIYFGPFSFAPQDPALSRLALLKLSFVYRYFLQAAGIRYQVNRQTVTITGSINLLPLATCAEILAQQIQGVEQVINETELAIEDRPAHARALGAIQLLLATDQSLRSHVKVNEEADGLRLSGSISSEAQRTWAEQLARAVDPEVRSDLTVVPAESMLRTADVDDESLEALVLFRLRLVRETEHLPLKVKAHRGVLTLQGKVRTEALRQRVEQVTRATLGLRELRSTLTVAP